MKTLKIIALSVLVMPVMVWAQTATTTLPNPGLTPDSPFYFLNRVGEALQEFFTVNPDAKARLQLQFAAERISEIQAMLAAKGVSAPGIEVAKTILNRNLERASEAVKKQKDSGKDAVELAKEISEKITSQKLALRSVFNEEDKDLSGQEKDLKEQVKEAENVKDLEKAQKLAKDLSAVSADREMLKKHEDDSSQEFDDEDEKVDSVLELKDQAQNAINDAKKERAELLVEIPALTADDLALADKAIASAEDLFVKGNYQASKELAHQAEKALERAKDAAERENETNEKELEAEKKLQEIQDEAAKKLEEIKSETEKELLELDKEIQKAISGESDD